MALTPSIPTRLRAPMRSVSVLLMAALLSACAATQNPGPTAEAQALADELRADMGHCVDALDDSERSLAQQSRHLVEQDKKLEAMHNTLLELESSVAGASERAVLAPANCEAADSAGSVEDKLLVGRQEHVWMEDLNLSLPARVDTGAETASIDARNIELFERNGDPWVRFEIVHPETGEPIPLERRLVRKARIVQANSEQAERRPVISLGIVVGSVRQQAEFTLSDRSHLDYQVLVGRNILADMMIVDVSQTNIAPPQVPQQEADSSP